MADHVYRSGKLRYATPNAPDMTSLAQYAPLTRMCVSCDTERCARVDGTVLWHEVANSFGDVGECVGVDLPGLQVVRKGREFFSSPYITQGRDPVRCVVTAVKGDDVHYRVGIKPGERGKGTRFTARAEFDRCVKVWCDEGV